MRTSPAWPRPSHLARHVRRRRWWWYAADRTVQSFAHFSLCSRFPSTLTHSPSLFLFFLSQKTPLLFCFSLSPAMAKYSDNCADDVDTVLSKLQSDASTGLSSKEVEARQAIYGKNELPEEEGKKAFLTSRCALSLCESRHVWKNVTVVEKDDARRSFTASFNFVLPFFLFLLFISFVLPTHQSPRSLHHDCDCPPPKKTTTITKTKTKKIQAIPSGKSSSNSLTIHW